MLRVVRAAALQAEMPWAGLHTLRHSAATILFRQGWNTVQVRIFLPLPWREGFPVHPNAAGMLAVAGLLVEHLAVVPA